MPLCLMENIKKTYRMGDLEIEVLKGIHLKIEKGEFIAVMGTSGSGKTTLMNIIGCLDVPTSGRYMLADREVSNLTDDELSEIRSKHIGFVFPTLYIGSRRDKAEVYAMDLLKLFGLEERARFKRSIAYTSALSLRLPI